MPLEKTISPHGWSESRPFAKISTIELITGILLFLDVDHFTTNSLTCFLREALFARGLAQVTEKEANDALHWLKAHHVLNAIETETADKSYSRGSLLSIMGLRLERNGVLKTHEAAFRDLADAFAKFIASQERAA